jgi:hypothetical protein
LRRIVCLCFEKELGSYFHVTTLGIVRVLRVHCDMCISVYCCVESVSGLTTMRGSHTSEFLTRKKIEFRILVAVFFESNAVLERVTCC